VCWYAVVGGVCFRSFFIVAARYAYVKVQALIRSYNWDALTKFTSEKKFPISLKVVPLPPCNLPAEHDSYVLWFQLDDRLSGSLVD
jgi:hypothetical protein